ncbi:MAG TPA: 2-isopropylmalate synthase, partial [Thermoanaerobaculia bacterium]|nr:2-isopropylmalate synthase [Thermoanaerobaculia bacterium]
GAHRVHACALGIGERVGNTPMDQLLVNLQLLGWIDRDLTRLHDYCAAVSEATGVPIPDNYPIVGRDAFRTGTGVHAAAIIKARKKGVEWLADRVYSGVPASMIGRHQVIEVGPMCGLSNVQCWLADHGIDPRPEMVDAVFRSAKESDHVLADEEILEIVQRFAPAAAGRP